MPEHSTCYIVSAATINRCFKSQSDCEVGKTMSEIDKNRDKKVVKRIIAILCNSQQLPEAGKGCDGDPKSPKYEPQKMALQKGNVEYFEIMRAELDKLVRTLSKEDKMDLLQGWFRPERKSFVLKNLCEQAVVRNNNIIYIMCAELSARESLAKYTKEMEALLFDPRE